MSDPIRVRVVDDHDLERAGLVGLLAKDQGFQVVAEAADGREGSRLRCDTGRQSS